MDSRAFDDLLRSLTDSRRSVLGGSLAALGGLLGISAAQAKKKKKKKPCKKKCPDGCCTAKHGQCIRPAQQTPAQCGAGGEICRTNCGGSGSCQDGCDTCCAGDVCVDAGQISNDQCGTGGEACFACPPGQACNAPGAGCCALKGAACGSNGVTCCNEFSQICQSDVCCVRNGGGCEQTTDCCDEADVCEGGQCGRPLAAPCVPGQLLCIPSLACNPETLTCGPEDCTATCAELERCSEQVCLGVLNCCTQATFDECSESEDFCGCITEGGECTRIGL